MLKKYGGGGSKNASVNFRASFSINSKDVAHAVDASFGNVKMTLKSVIYLTTSIAVFTRWP